MDYTGLLYETISQTPLTPWSTRKSLGPKPWRKRVSSRSPPAMIVHLSMFFESGWRSATPGHSVKSVNKMFSTFWWVWYVQTTSNFRETFAYDTANCGWLVTRLHGLAHSYWENGSTLLFAPTPIPNALGIYLQPSSYVIMPTFHGQPVTRNSVRSTLLLGLMKEDVGVKRIGEWAPKIAVNPTQMSKKRGAQKKKLHPVQYIVDHWWTAMVCRQIGDWSWA